MFQHQYPPAQLHVQVQQVSVGCVPSVHGAKIKKRFLCITLPSIKVCLPHNASLTASLEVVKSLLACAL